MSGGVFLLPPGWAVPFAALSASLGGGQEAVGSQVAHRDPSGPFRVEATLGEWRVSSNATSPRLALSIARGTLFDDDKGAVDLAGYEVRIGSEMDQPEVLNPGRLSELQQVGVAGAIGYHLRATRGLNVGLALLQGLHGIASMPGVLMKTGGLAAFGIPRIACDAAGALSQLSALATAGESVRLTTFPAGASVALQLHSVSVDVAVCLVGRLGSIRVL